MAVKKMTVKEISSEIEMLIEVNLKKDDLIKTLDEKVSSLQLWAQEMFSSIHKKIGETDQVHFNNAKKYRSTNKRSRSEDCQSCYEQEVKEEPSKLGGESARKQFDCKQCRSAFRSKADLRKHIQSIHPKTVKCDMCDENFDQIWKLEVHLKKHPTEKYFECDICDKQFALQWRLNKHKRGHTDGTGKFCHYFNNNKNCIFEETSGCMFRHETSPICKDLKKCKFTKCQFTHTSDEHHSD